MNITSPLPEEQSRIDAAADWIADQLVGQCVHDVEYFIDYAQGEGKLDAEEAKDPRLLALIYDAVFCCDGCGWWCSTDELFNDEEDEGCEHCDDCKLQGGIE